jgi:hypothetical protein
VHDDNEIMAPRPTGFGKEVAENELGGVFRIRDIPGVGDTTQRNLRRIGVRDVGDVADMTASELTRAEGVGMATAERIKDAVPEDNSNSSTISNTSAAGLPAFTGEFRPEITDFDKADATFGTSLNRGELSSRHRTQEAAAADKGKRAPITTDLEEWKENKDEFDFAGVDTPTEDPEIMEKDIPFVSEEDIIEDVEDDFF